MAAGFAKAGNELYTGERSYPFIQRSNIWFLIAAVLVIASVIIPVMRAGFNLGIEFTGGSEFTISAVEDTDPAIGEDAVQEVAGQEAVVTNVAGDTMRVQTEELDEEETLEVAGALQEGYDVGADQVSSTFIGPVWGDHITQQMLIGLAVFLVLVALYMAFYFRTWKMSAAALAGLAFVVVTTIGIYSLTDFEVTPSAVIGFLTILSYALYDTMVVFDKIRENTGPLLAQKDQTFTERVNLAINQTLVRSINTSVVGLLPVGSILFIGSWLLGAGTLRDIALALFTGIIIGTVATIFIQAPLYARLRRGDADIAQHTQEVLALRGDRLEEAGIASLTYSGTPLTADGEPTAFPPLPEPDEDEEDDDDGELDWELVITPAEAAAQQRQAGAGDEGQQTDGRSG